MPIQAPKGTRDILPEDINQWNYVEKEFARVCEKFGYKEIRLLFLSILSFFNGELGIPPMWSKRRCIL